MQYQAKEVGTGDTVQGWYAVLHIPNVNAHDIVEGYKERHCLFNDAPGSREGSYWHEIDIETLKPINAQLNLFDL